MVSHLFCCPCPCWKTLRTKYTDSTRPKSRGAAATCEFGCGDSTKMGTISEPTAANTWIGIATIRQPLRRAKASSIPKREAMKSGPRMQRLHALRCQCCRVPPRISQGWQVVDQERHNVSPNAEPLCETNCIHRVVDFRSSRSRHV